MYLRRHLITTVESLIEQMIVREHAAIISPSEDREKILKEVTSKQAKQLRKRTNVGKGRKRENRFPDTTRSESESFANQCAEIVKRLKLVGIKINRTSLARELFPNNTNSLQELRRKLNKFDYSYDELMDLIDGKTEIPGFHIVKTSQAANGFKRHKNNRKNT